MKKLFILPGVKIRGTPLQVGTSYGEQEILHKYDSSSENFHHPCMGTGLKDLASSYR